MCSGCRICANDSIAQITALGNQATSCRSVDGFCLRALQRRCDSLIQCRQDRRSCSWVARRNEFGKLQSSASKATMSLQREQNDVYARILRNARCSRTWAAPPSRLAAFAASASLDVASATVTSMYSGLPTPEPAPPNQASLRRKLQRLLGSRPQC